MERGHLNRIWYQSQQQNLTAITEHLSSLKPEELSATMTRGSVSSSIANGQTNGLRGQVSRIPRAIQSPVQRVGFELESDTAIQNLASNLSKDQTMTSRPLADSEVGRSALSSIHKPSRRSRQQTWTKDKLSVRKFVKQTSFGAITTTTRTRLLISEFVDDDTLYDEECEYERVSSFRIFLARWLLKLGFNYAYSFSTYNSSTQGWQFSLKSINLVPDDASIFEFCRHGNIEKVRQLISRNLASVRDVDSEGRTALHVSHVALRLLEEVFPKVLGIQLLLQVRRTKSQPRAMQVFAGSGSRQNRAKL